MSCFTALIIYLAIILFSFSLRHSKAEDYNSKLPLILTPYLEKGEIEEARTLAKVASQKHFGNTNSYSGFFTVNDISNIFFWFFPAETKTKSPLLLWLNGGPGSSSQFGLFVENGPFYVNETSVQYFRQTSWTKTNAVLYIDSPVGTGFSFTDQDSGYSTSMGDVTKGLLDTLCQFFQLFPEYKVSKFYLTGESFAGQYIPNLALKILEYKKQNSSCCVLPSLSGIAIGNGFIDPENSLNYSEFLYNLGLIDRKTKVLTAKHQKEIIKLIRQEKWREAFKKYDDFIGYSGLEDNFVSNVTGLKCYYNILTSTRPPDYDWYKKFVEQEEIREIVHVGSKRHFQSGDIVMKKLEHEIMKSAKHQFAALIKTNIPLLLYNGQLDLIVANVLTDSFLATLNFTEFDQSPRHIWKLSSTNEVVGYFKTYKNFTRLTMRNAGHILPHDKPIWGYELIQNFITGVFTSSGMEKKKLLKTAKDQYFDKMNQHRNSDIKL